jgi:hypothetical protein
VAQQKHRKPGRQIQVRRRRRQTKGKFRLLKPHWIDPYPFIPGTEPEKRIFQALVMRRIYFIFQGQVPELTPGGMGIDLRKSLDKQTIRAGGRVASVTLGLVAYIPDFVIPEYRVIIDPFSPFHHSQQESVERDVRKVSLYNTLGYDYYHPWAVAPGEFVLDQRPQTIGRWRTRKVKVARTSLTQHVYLGTRPGKPVPHVRSMGAVELLDSLPGLHGGIKFPLVDPLDIEAKKKQGYRLGQGLGAGATSVAAANRKRRRMPSLGMSIR